MTSGMSSPPNVVHLDSFRPKPAAPPGALPERGTPAYEQHLGLVIDIHERALRLDAVRLLKVIAFIRSL